jgi:methionine-rich copper-binding protein CopC
LIVRWLTSACAAVMVTLGVALVGTGPAAAHAELVAAEPDQDATVSTLDVVRLRFTEPLRPEFSALVVTATDGALVVSGSPAVAGTEISVPVTVTDGGSYTVAYRVLSPDGHPVEGSYTVTFTPQPAASAAAPPPTSMGTPPPTTRSASPTAADEPGGGASGAAAEKADAGDGMSLVGVGGGLLSCAALVGAGLVWRRRMRDHA